MKQNAQYLAFVLVTNSAVPDPIQCRFDTDSLKIGVDTLCSITMSSKKDNFQD
jgi:hypothetical protein